MELNKTQVKILLNLMDLERKPAKTRAKEIKVSNGRYSKNANKLYENGKGILAFEYSDVGVKKGEGKCWFIKDDLKHSIRW
jgi:hypothetical protein